MSSEPEQDMTGMAQDTTQAASRNRGAEGASGPARSPGRKLLFSFILLLALGCLGELGLRVTYRVVRGSWNFAGTLDESEKLYVPHPYNAYSLAPNVTIETHVGTLHINQWGNRGPSQPYEKPPGVVRIVTLGGSTTFCPYAGDDAKAWPAQLEQKLCEHYGAGRIEVINYAAAGYNSADSLTTFALRAIDRDPDIVIVHHAWNDINAGIAPGLVSDYSHRRKVGSHRRKGWWFNLAVYRACLILGKRMAAANHPLGTAEHIDSRAVEIFERNLESIVLLAKPRGIEPVLLTLSTRMPPDNDPDWETKIARFGPKDVPMWREFTPAGMFRAFQAYNDATRRIAERQGVVLVDLANTYPREDRYFIDFGHKTDLGLELFAEMVAEALIAEGVVERALAGAGPAARNGR